MTASVTATLNEIQRRISLKARDLVHGRWQTQRDIRTLGEHYVDGQLAGLDYASGVVNAVRDEIVEEAERRQRAATGQGFTKAKHR